MWFGEWYAACAVVLYSAVVSCVVVWRSITWFSAVYYGVMWCVLCRVGRMLCCVVFCCVVLCMWRVW